MLLLLYPHLSVTLRLLTAAYHIALMYLEGVNPSPEQACFPGHCRRKQNTVTGTHLPQATPTVKGSDCKCDYLISHLLVIEIPSQINSLAEGFSPLSLAFCNPLTQLMYSAQRLCTVTRPSLMAGAGRGRGLLPSLMVARH